MMISLKHAAHRLAGSSIFSEMFRGRRTIQRVVRDGVRALYVALPQAPATGTGIRVSHSAPAAFFGRVTLANKELGERNCLTEKAGCRHLQVLRDAGWECKTERSDKSLQNACKCSNAPVYKLDARQVMTLTN